VPPHVGSSVELLAFFHNSSIQRLKRSHIVRIKFQRSLQHKPGDALRAGRSRQRSHVHIIGGVAVQQTRGMNVAAGNLSVAGFVHQWQPHMVWLAGDVIFAGTVKVELCQLVALVSHDEEVSLKSAAPLCYEQRATLRNRSGTSLLLLPHARTRQKARLTRPRAHPNIDRAHALSDSLLLERILLS
jgi:hypothetical protein